MDTKKAEEKLIIFKENPTYDNAISYIISFIEKYKGYQGYYEYYRSNYGGCIKVHYHGEFNRFIIDKDNSRIEDKHLVFTIKAKAVVEESSCIGERTNQSLYEEIKRRAMVDIIVDLKKELKKSLGKLFDLQSLTLEFNPVWELELLDELY